MQRSSPEDRARAKQDVGPMMQEARQERIVPLLLYLFTAVTGLVDAVSYIGLGHIFTANMTGNIVLLGFAFAGVPGLSALRSLTALAAFLVGAVIGGRLATTLAPLSSNRWRMTAFGCEAVFLLGSTLERRSSRFPSTQLACMPSSCLQLWRWVSGTPLFERLLCRI